MPDRICSINYDKKMAFCFGHDSAWRGMISEERGMVGGSESRF